jgi:methylated-DNA-[protein]-cysteine S-methyltransferase
MKIFYKKLLSPLGNIHVYASEDALLGIYFDADLQQKSRFTHLPVENIIKRSSPLIKELQIQLRDYFKGNIKEFNLPLQIVGTNFQKKAWRTLLKIPYGDLWSYQKQAIKAGSPGATRAIGSANGKNHFPIIIPCHRVTRINGNLGGYSGGCDIKLKLIKIEQKFNQSKKR